jgi:hypothetical protein
MEGGLAPDWALVVEGDQLLAATDDAWRDLLAYHARRALGLAPAPHGDLARADLLRTLAFPEEDGRFRAGMLPLAVEEALGALGLDAGRVRVDAEARPAKWPGAHALGGRVSFRAQGGLGDWQGLLDAAARAAAAGAPALAPALGWLAAALLLEPGWLARRCDVERKEAADVVRAVGLRALCGLRAAGAALRVAVEVERGLSGQAWREAYREAMSAALLARWDGVRAGRDGLAAPHAARLTGFAEGERLRASLRERFDEDWWRNPRTKEHLSGLVAGGAVPGERASPAAEAAGLARVLERGAR